MLEVVTPATVVALPGELLEVAEPAKVLTPPVASVGLLAPEQAATMTAPTESTSATGMRVRQREVVMNGHRIARPA
jgi:hypothetical protein